VFVAKCETYLHLGLGLVVVDVVTVRKANLHDELFSDRSNALRLDANLYAVAYRVVERNGAASLDLWTQTHYWRCTADNAAVVAWRTLPVR